MNISCIIVDKPIPGLAGLTYNKCTTLAEVLAAMAGAAAVDIYAVSGVYDPATETIVITLSNNSTFTIPAALLLPVVADGDSITGNGTAGNPLKGYKVEYDAAGGALTITPPGGTPVNVPAQTAGTESAIDSQDVVGNGAGATVTTQQLLDGLAATSHPAATAAAASNPALTLDPVTQVANLDLNAAGSYDNAGSGLSAESVQGALDELAACCPSDSQLIPAGAFVDPAHPTTAEVQAWSSANGPFGPNTLLVYPGMGSFGDPDYVWEVDRSGGVINLADRACCPGATLEIPASAFADPANPTQAEAQAWIDGQGALSPGTQIIYNTSLAGNLEDPDFVWLVNEIGDAPSIKDDGRFFVTAGPDAATIVTGPVPVPHGDRLHLWGNSLSFAVVAGSALVQGELTAPTQSPAASAELVGGVLNLPNPLPVASFTRTSKIGLTAAYSAVSSSGTQDGNPVTYDWAAGGPGTVTFGTPTGSVTTVVFGAPGQYTINMQVTDANGNSASHSQTINVARLLEVGSPDESANDYLATVTAALAWLAANDPTNSYEIIVRSNTVEPAPITNADRVHIHYASGAASSFAGDGYGWTSTPVDLKLTGASASPYAPAVIAGATALSLTGIDASQMQITNIAFLTTGFRAIVSSNVDNLYLEEVGARSTSSDPYTTAHNGGVNLTLVRCAAVGNGIAYALVPVAGRANSMRLLDSYGEVSSTPATFTLATLYLPGTIAVGMTQEILVANNVLINNGAGNNGSGVPRAVVVNGGSATSDPTGAKLVGNQLIQRRG